jgi:hypothetical protein
MLSQPKTIFGIHQLTAYNICNGEPYGTAKVLGSAEIASSGELIPLNGGSSKYPWQVERGLITNEVTLTLREYPNFLYELLLGKAPTVTGAETSGSVSTLENVEGTSVSEATTGIASLAISSAVDVKYSEYVIVAVSATEVDVYAYTDVDFAQGSSGDYVNDALKITSTPLTVTATAVTIPNFGIDITGGAGTIGFTIGDTARFTAKPINTGSTDVVIGSSTEVFKDFGLLLAAQRAGDGSMQLIDLYRVSGSGMPIVMTENAFSELSTTVTAYRDSVRNGVYSVKTIASSSEC